MRAVAATNSAAFAFIRTIQLDAGFSFRVSFRTCQTVIAASPPITLRVVTRHRKSSPYDWPVTCACTYRRPEMPPLSHRYGESLLDQFIAHMLLDKLDVVHGCYASICPSVESRLEIRIASSRDMFGSRFSRHRLTVDLLTPATWAIVVVPISAIWRCSQLSILRASTLLRVVDVSICDNSIVKKIYWLISQPVKLGSRLLKSAWGIKKAPDTRLP